MFSQRIWKLRDYTDNVVSQTITQGILESKSAREIAKDLEAFLVQKAEGRAALHGLPHKQAWHRGDVVYNTQRLARTEINNAFREAQVETAKNATYIKGVKWRLSASHPVADICDTWASQDLYEMGPGCYPPDKAPIDHPNGLCFLTDILKTRDEMMATMKGGREQITVKETPKGVVEGTPKTAKAIRERLINKFPNRTAYDKIVIEHEQAKDEARAVRKLRDDLDSTIQRLRAKIKTPDDVISFHEKEKQLIDEIRKLQPMLAEKNQKLIEIVARRDQIKQEMTKGAVELLHYNKDGFDLPFTNLSKNKKFEKLISEQLKEISKLINKDKIRILDFGIDTGGGRRASAGRGIMNLGVNSPIKTTAHEYGHLLEDSNNDIHDKVYKFREARTQGEQLRSLNSLAPDSGYSSREFGKKDKFIDVYMGREYSGRTNTEILSMGMTMLFEDPYTLATKDPEYFDLIISILHGIE